MKIIISILAILVIVTACQLEQPNVSEEMQIAMEEGKAFNIQSFPEQIVLPTGFAPEGIVAGKGSDFYVGSLVAGAIYKGDFRTGAGAILVPQVPGRIAVGLDYDHRTDYLYVAGTTGVAYVYNASSGDLVSMLELNSLDVPFTFINDCIVTREAVYFTDSFRPVFYRVALLKNGELPAMIEVQEIPLTGEFQFLPWDPPGDPATLTINGNGIVATPNGKQLIIGNSQTGLLYLVDPMTGVATEIDLAGGPVFNDDGLVLQGKTLYVVQNFLNQISVVELSQDYAAGEVIAILTHPEYKIPATATLFGNRLYAVNARFDVAPPPLFGGDPTGVEFDVIGVPAK